MIKHVDPNTAVTARKFNELVDALNSMLGTSGGKGVNVTQGKGGMNITTTPAQETNTPATYVRCYNQGAGQIGQYGVAEILSALYSPSDPRYVKDVILRVRTPTSEAANKRPFVIAAEPIASGAMGRCAVSGLTPALLYGVGGGGSGLQAGINWTGVYPGTLSIAAPGCQLVAGVGSFISPVLGLVVLGGGGGSNEASTSLDIVATLPALPTEEGEEKKVFWGKSATIEGGTGDDQVWHATWKDLRWHPYRPTTKDGTPAPPEDP
mgnify:CR=1 FL=1